MSTVSTPVDTPAEVSVHQGGSYPWTTDTGGHSDLVSDTAQELLRTALLAKLAVDLGDPALARRAARYAQSSAQLLAGLDIPTHVDDEELPKVDDLLAQRMPSRAEVEQTGGTPSDGIEAQP